MTVSGKNTWGFTLIEIMVVLAIFSFIVGGIINAKIRQLDQHITQLQAAEMQQCVRSVMMLMKEELRMAGFNDLETNHGEGISLADPTQITFSSVIDNAGNLDVVTYTYDGADKNIRVAYNGGGAQVIAENIQNLTFSYFNKDGNDSSASPQTTRTMQISITATTDENELIRAQGNNTRTLTATVFLRNMGI